MVLGPLASIKEWGGIADLAPDDALEDIVPIWKRAYCLLTRNAETLLLQTKFIHVYGAVEMMHGLDYHAQNFARACADESMEVFAPNYATDHEAVAYLNRMGQFWTFANSELVTQALSDVRARLPTVAKLIIFRNKVAAHRSIDAPRGEEPSEAANHARSICQLGGRLYSPRPSAPHVKMPQTTSVPVFLEYMREMRRRCCLTYQIYDAKSTDHLNFTLELEHPQIMNECYCVLEQLVTRSPTAPQP